MANLKLVAICVILAVNGLASPEGEESEAGLGDLSRVEELLKQIPDEQFENLQKLAGRVIGEMAEKKRAQADDRIDDNVVDNSDEFQAAILAAMKKEGLLDSWKKQLETLIFDDSVKFENNREAEKFQAGLKCSKDKPEVEETPKDPEEKPAVLSMDEMEKAVHQMLGNDQVVQNEETNQRGDQDARLQQSAEHLAANEPSPRLTVPKAEEPPKVSKQTNKEEARPKTAKTKKKPKKKPAEPLDALVGLAKQYLGQDESDPTLDILANMASAYLKREPEKSGKSTDKSGGLDLASMLQLASMFTGESSANGNVLQSLSNMMTAGDGSQNGGMDWQQLIQLGSLLVGKPDEADRKTSPIAGWIVRMVANFLDVDPDLMMKYYTGFQELVETNSWDEINQVLRTTTGTDVEAFLDLLDSDDVRENLAESTSASVAQWIQNFLSPESLKTKTFYVNSFLLQYNYPAIDHKNLIETSSIVLDRLAKEFLSSEIHSKVYMKEAEKQLKKLLHVDPSDEINLRNYTQAELTGALSYSVKVEVFDALAQVWSDYKLALRHPKCARTIFCLRNLPDKIRTPLGLRSAVSRASSTAVVWILSKSNSKSMPTFNDLYMAVWDGAQGKNCKTHFKENCAKVLEDDQPKLTLNFDHHEL